MLNSVLSNPKTRICFRLGDNDAKKLATGFSYFEASDLQGLATGQAIMKIGSINNDFNLATAMLKDIDHDYSREIMANVRERYALPKNDVEELLNSLLPQMSKRVRRQEQKVDEELVIVSEDEKANIPSVERNDIEIVSTSLEERKNKHIQRVTEQEQDDIHRSLQNHILKLGQQRNFLAEIETATSDGGRIDVTLRNDDVSIAIEVSVSNTISYEVQNIRKCIEAQYDIVFMVSESKIHLKNIKKSAADVLSKDDSRKVKYGTPSQFLTYINTFVKKPKKLTKRVRGYKVNLNHVDVNDDEAKIRNSKIQDIILKSVKKKPKKD